MNTKFADVVKVIAEANIDFDILGNKNSEENVSDRIAEAVKFAPYINGDKKPVLAQSTIFNYAKEQGLKLANVQLQHWHKGKKVPSSKGAAPVAVAAIAPAIQMKVEGEIITSEQKQFFDLLLLKCKSKASTLLQEVYEEMANQKIVEAEERIKRELMASMGGIAELIKEEPPVVVEYPEELQKKAKEALDKATAGEKVPVKVIQVAKLVMNKAPIDEAQQALLG